MIKTLVFGEPCQWSLHDLTQTIYMDNSTLTDIINAPLDDLLNEASRIRTETFGNKIELCGLVNVKNGRCTMDCRFCAQSQHHDTAIETFPLLNASQLAVETLKLKDQNVRQIGLVSSGLVLTREEINEIVDATFLILRVWDKLHLCASLGQLQTPALTQLKAAGVRRYHHNLETSERFYPSICTTQRWQDRRATVERAKDLGLEVCCGGLFGIGETWEDRWQLAGTLKELNVDSVPINFYNAIPGTPLAEQPPLSVEEALRIVVLFRLALPKAAIRICGGRPTVFANREQDVLLFRAGANALMTGDYLTTSGISPEVDREMIERGGF